KLQDDYDVQVTNIVLQGLPHDMYALVNDCHMAKDIWDRVKLLMQGTELSYQEHECKLYNEFDKFTSVKAPHHPQQYQHPFQIQTNHTPPSVPQIAYHTPLISQQPQAKFSQLDSGLAVPSFLPGNKGNATSFRGNNAASQARVVKCYNFQGEGHLVLDEEQLAFLADRGFANVQVTQTIIPLNVTFQIDDLDAYDSDCDDISSAKAVLMANLSSYDSDDLSEVPQHDTSQNDNMLNQSVQETQYFEQSLIDYVLDNEITSDSNIISYEQFLQQMQNAIVQDTNSSSQQDSMIISMFEQMSKQMSNYKAQRIKTTLYDGNVISKKQDIIFVVDEEETLILEEEIRSKMLTKQNDPFSKEKKINISPINYPKLNKLDEEFGKRFVPQKELSTEQALWLSISNLISEQPVVQTTPVRTEAPSELQKESMVKTSFQKLKNHLASFDKVVKVRTTPDIITEGSWGFEPTKAVFKQEVIPFIKTLRDLFKDFYNGLHNELNEVKTVFNQMKAAVEQCSVDKKYFDIQKKKIFLDND
ncbi:hypothetical protein Tco_0438294, partial [Tanacetum coccineum]